LNFNHLDETKETDFKLLTNRYIYLYVTPAVTEHHVADAGSEVTPGPADYATHNIPGPPVSSVLR